MYLPSLSRILMLFAFLLSAAGGAWAATEAQTSTAGHGRLAIVVGNSTYQNDRYEDLSNAANDARKLAESLRRLNFEVITGIDVTAKDFAKIMADVEAQIENYDSVVLFYAGHGMQSNGLNYLLPVDTPIPESIEAITTHAIKLNNVINRLSNRERQTFVFLDACRNNPLGEGANNGLAQIEVGENTFIAFATQPGNVTVDGTGDHSPFTTALLDNIEIPGLSISDMMIRVRNKTEALTVGRQVPWDQSNLREQFYFTEQQKLDASELSASLSNILAHPDMKKKLLAELASSDLQSAVLIVGQQLRSVDVDSPGNEAGTGNRAVEGTQVASLEPSLTVEQARQSVVSNLQTLIVGSSESDSSDPRSEKEKAEHIDLVKSVQTELQRLGCYRMGIDGIWGPGSSRALRNYYKNTDQARKYEQPNAQLLGDLFLQSGRICKAPVKVKPPATAQIVNRSKHNSASRSSGRQRQRQAEERPAAPPPDINAGIGIGGIF